MKFKEWGLWRWLSPQRWQIYSVYLRRREQLALLLWPYLPASLRHADDQQPLRQLVTVVQRLEAGNDEFSDNVDAAALWRAASGDDEVQQCTGALRTLKLQLSGEASVAGLVVGAPARPVLKQLRKTVQADSRYDELDVWQHLPALLPFFSVLILLSGWFYNLIYLGQLGLPISKYFGLSDYLAASMEGLVFAAVSVLVSIAIQWLGRGRIRLQNLQRLLGVHRRYQLLSLSVLFGWAIAFGVWIDEPNAQRIVYGYVAMIGASTLLIPWLTGFSRRPARAMLLLYFLVIYSTVLWFVAEMRYLTVLRASPIETEVRLTVAPDAPKTWRLLSGNSLYLFFHTEQQEVIAVPVQQVLSVRYQPAPPNDAPLPAAPASTPTSTSTSAPQATTDVQ